MSWRRSLSVQETATISLQFSTFLLFATSSGAPYFVSAASVYRWICPTQRIERLVFEFANFEELDSTRIEEFYNPGYTTEIRALS
jgi:hypothetical protein